MKTFRQQLNKQQTELRRVMIKTDQHDLAVRLFLSQHAQLHSAGMAQSGFRSFEDEVLANMTDAQMRCIPRNGEHSAAWCLWHIARIEDVAMNLLVAGRPQVLQQENWLERIKAPIRHTGNAMDVPAVAELSQAVDLPALLEYRIAVGRSTREIVQQLTPETLKQKVDPTRIRQVLQQGAVIPAAGGVTDYWSRRTIAGLLLMPATRHPLVHLYEVFMIRKKCK